MYLYIYLNLIRLIYDTIILQLLSIPIVFVMVYIFIITRTHHFHLHLVSNARKH